MGSRSSSLRHISAYYNDNHNTFWWTIAFSKAVWLTNYFCGKWLHVGTVAVSKQVRVDQNYYGFCGLRRRWRGNGQGHLIRLQTDQANIQWPRKGKLGSSQDMFDFKLHNWTKDIVSLLKENFEGFLRKVTRKTKCRVQVLRRGSVCHFGEVHWGS